MEAFINTQMYTCRGPLTQMSVMEDFLGSNLVFLHFPTYFPSPADACMQQYILQGFQRQLDAVKGVHSREMLAYKSALLDMAVNNGFCIGMGEAIARILKVYSHNIRRVVDMKARMAESGESEFSLQKRRKRTNVLDSATVALVELYGGIGKYKFLQARRIQSRNTSTAKIHHLMHYTSYFKPKYVLVFGRIMRALSLLVISSKIRVCLYDQCILHFQFTLHFLSSTCTLDCCESKYVINTISTYQYGNCCSPLSFVENFLSLHKH